MTKNAILERGPKISGMGRPPPPLIRAMPERKRFFFIEAFPQLLCITALQNSLSNQKWEDCKFKLYCSVVSSSTGSKGNGRQEKRLVQLNQRKRWKTTLSHLPQTTHRLCRYVMRLFLDWLCKTVTHLLLSCSKGLNCRISNGPWSVILQKVPENISEKSRCWPEWLGSVKEVLDPVLRLNADKRPADRESQTNPFLF